jgi:hypothetical protein
MEKFGKIGWIWNTRGEIKNKPKMNYLKEITETKTPEVINLEPIRKIFI